VTSVSAVRAYLDGLGCTCDPVLRYRKANREDRRKLGFTYRTIVVHKITCGYRDDPARPVHLSHVRGSGRMKYACPMCGRITQTRYCALHQGNPNATTRNPRRDMAAHARFARAVKARDGHQCVTCGSTVDLRACHIVPLHMGGNDDPSNGQCKCRRCDMASDRYAR
jgi:hypothetical protein